MNYKVYIGLPAYNEAAGIAALLEQLIPLGYAIGDSQQLRVIVVNDGSTDRTAHILKAYSNKYTFVKSIHHSHNQGLGKAMNTLFSYILKHSDDRDLLVTMDADNTHDPQIIPSMIRKLMGEDLDVIIASRFAEGGGEVGISLLRKIFSRGARLFFYLFFPIPNVRDYSSGFRCYRVGYLRNAILLHNGAFITSSGFESMAEILARFSQIGVKAGEYPLLLRYHLKQGKSKMRIVATIRGYFRLVRTVKFSKTLGRTH